MKRIAIGTETSKAFVPCLHANATFMASMRILPPQRRRPQSRSSQGNYEDPIYLQIPRSSYEL